MRRLLVTICILLAFCATARAQTKISALPEATTVTSDDLLVVVDSPASAGATKKITFGNFGIALFGSKTTTDLTEGSNLYWTTSRFNTAFGGKSTTDLAEGTNLYWTTARFTSAFGGKSTTDLSEGSNLYFTNTRADTRADLRIAAALGVTVQAFNSHLSAISGLTPTANDILQFKSGAWANRTIAQVKADLSFSFSDIGGTISTGQQPSTTVNSVVNDTNINGSISGQALTFSWAGTLGKSRQHAATVYTDQANTYSAGAQDFGSASSLKVPTSAGASPNAAGQVAYDSTANLYKGFNGTALKTFAFTDSNITGNAATATALAANGSNCSAGNAAAGVDAAGAAEGCAALPANTSSTASQFFTSYNSTSGAFTKAQPAFSDVSGTCSIAQGCTGQTSKAAGFDALSPNSTLGDFTYHNGTNNVRLAGNTAAAKKFLTQTGNGTISAAPGWNAIVAGDIPDISATYGLASMMPVYARVTGSNATTTSTTLVDVTGLNVPLAANSVYEFVANLTGNGADSNGVKFGVNYSAAGATVEAGIYADVAGTGTRTRRINALGSATLQSFFTSSNDVAALIQGTITTGANAGNITIQHLKGTSGTSTIYIGSFLKVTKIQ